MSTFGLSDSGYRAPRMADILAQMQADLEARLGVSIDWNPETGDLVLQNIFAVVAARVGAISEASQAVYDARNRDAATGIQLDDLGTIIGVERRAATFSTATVTCSGIPGTMIPAGKLVGGGGVAGDAQWALTSAPTIGGGGTVDVTVQCTMSGAVAATSGQIDAILQPVAGWTSVTNANAAATGQPYQSDADYRFAQENEVEQQGTSSLAAIRANILAVDADTGLPPTGVTQAIVIDNPTSATVVTGGVTLLAYSVAIIVYPGSLTDDQITQLALVIYSNVPAATYMNGAQSKTVTGADGFPKTVRWAYASTTGVTIVVHVTELLAGYTVASVTDAVTAAITAYFATLQVGDQARYSKVYAAAAAVEGVEGITLTMNGGTLDIPNSATYNTLPTIASISVTT